MKSKGVVTLIGFCFWFVCFRHQLCAETRADSTAEGVVKEFLCSLDSEDSPDIFSDLNEIWRYTMGRSGKPNLVEVWNLIRRWRPLFCTSRDKPAETGVLISGVVTFTSLSNGKAIKPVVILLITRSAHYGEQHSEPVFFPVSQVGDKWRIHCESISFDGFANRTFYQYLALK